ncbi:hypothetical protein CONCODRAFT_8680 [Conidiobolus coronatus NRRL 28638]|uniref:Uncharacterized protein n=1 Tax=Conidiobolus coronatus (strain ATCC 28846 / CBS 209.66 / NRRL 28638) TaxID=796925 RepID=A0A137P267_CONC2|nr:hypothetical protein CONCODRAFT_8680 [Conidiobolus coronatus NRRL 28638]|eukprot:KXN68981.1 hypothetical protein CONCODRAFT_8680 [Conidiobolus coronatus NRRL 28638]
MSVVKRFNSNYVFESIKDHFINKFKQTQIINTTSNAKVNSSNPNIIVFGKDILHDLSKNSIPIQTLVIAIPSGTSIPNRLNRNMEIANQIKAKNYYNINTQNLKSLIHKTHKFNPSEVFGIDHIKSFSPYNTLLFDQNFSEGVLSSLIHTVNLFGPVSEDLSMLKDVGFSFNLSDLNHEELGVKLDEANSLIRDESDKKPKFICFFGDNGGSNGSEKINVNTGVDAINDGSKFDSLIAGSLILSKLLQAKK